MTDLEDAIGRFETLGGTFRFEGEKVELEYPENQRDIVSELLARFREHRTKLIQLLTDRTSTDSSSEQICYPCHGNQWWQRPGGDRVCSTCHPQSLPNVETGSLGVVAPNECPPLPKGVRLVRYQPKTPPVAVNVCTVVVDVHKFIQAHLAELDARLHHPLQIRARGSVFEILAKLAEVGVEVAVEAHPPSRE